MPNRRMKDNRHETRMFWLDTRKTVFDSDRTWGSGRGCPGSPTSLHTWRFPNPWETYFERSTGPALRTGLDWILAPIQPAWVCESKASLCKSQRCNFLYLQILDFKFFFPILPIFFRWERNPEALEETHSKPLAALEENWQIITIPSLQNCCLTPVTRCVHFLPVNSIHQRNPKHTQTYHTRKQRFKLWQHRGPC